MQGTLYVVATPIGNLNDCTPRAVEILNTVDLIAAEDTRNTMKLLSHFDIHTPLTANHKFNELKAVDGLIGKLLEGQNIAVVSDAGTPCINDPGFILVKAASERGITVCPIPGSCAAATAVSASGLPSDTFCFCGFFPRDKKEASKLYEYIANNRKELYIFYESPKRILDTIEWFEDNLPTAELALCNDLTKQHELIYRGIPSKVLAELNANPNHEKGEYALVCYYEPPVKEAEASDDALSLEAQLVDVMVKQNVSMKEAIAILAPTAKGGKKEVYQASLNLKDLF